MTNKHCCETMTDKVNYVCKQHKDPFDCPDNLIFYSARFDEYGIIIHDGGSSFIEISFCPWCGTKLPMSKRDLWFDTLEELGYDDPFEQDIPEEFKSDKWYNI
jgi:hypothetical protein